MRELKANIVEFIEIISFQSGSAFRWVRMHWKPVTFTKCMEESKDRFLFSAAGSELLNALDFKLLLSPMFAEDDRKDSAQLKWCGYVLEDESIC